jgi:hypothetical protein
VEVGYRALWIISVVLGVPSVPASHGCFPLPLIYGSDDDRANLMWKRYLEREDSKIVGMIWGKKSGGGICVKGCRLERKNN